VTTTKPSLARIAQYLWLGYSAKRICQLLDADPETVKAMKKRFI
jgi:DNA-binding CsgD family transcriptional regulator